MLLDEPEPASATVVRVKLLAPLPPFREADILCVRPLSSAMSAGTRFVLARRDGDVTLCPSGHAPGPPSEIVGAVAGVERARCQMPLDRAPWCYLPPRLWPRALDALEILRRFGHPLTPPLFQGAGAALLAGVRDKYDTALETRQYAALATGEADEVERALVTEHVPSGGRILDIGCGAGREAVAFARLGYRVVGIDIAPGMVDAARRRAEALETSVEFRVQSATELDETAGSYDAAFCGGSLHHIPGRALRIETLRRIAGTLVPAGVLILLVVYRERRGVLSRSRLVDFVRTLARALGAGAAVAEPGDGYMAEVSEASDPRRACFFHHYDGAPDIARELEAAGLAAREVRPGWWVCRRDGARANVSPAFTTRRIPREAAR